MITRNVIRLHFFLIMLAVFVFAAALGKALPYLGVETYLMRTLCVFLGGYACFFGMVKLWLAYLDRSRLLKDVANYSGKEKSKFEWSDFGGFDIPLGDNIFALIIGIIVLAIFIFVIGYLLSVEAPVLLIDAAFEAALAGGLLRTLRRRDSGSWLWVVFKRTIIFFLLALLIGSGIAMTYDKKCQAPQVSTSAGCLKNRSI
jgi:hypothetical protein